MLQIIKCTMILCPTPSRENTTNDNPPIVKASQGDVETWRENVHLRKWQYRISQLCSYCLLTAHPFTLVLAQKVLPNQAPSHLAFPSAWQPPSHPSRSPSQGPLRLHTRGDVISLHSPGILNMLMCNNTYTLLLIICLCVFPFKDYEEFGDRLWVLSTPIFPNIPSTRRRAGPPWDSAEMWQGTARRCLPLSTATRGQCGSTPSSRAAVPQKSR